MANRKNISVLAIPVSPVIAAKLDIGSHARCIGIVRIVTMPDVPIGIGPGRVFIVPPQAVAIGTAARRIDVAMEIVVVAVEMAVAFLDVRKHDVEAPLSADASVNKQVPRAGNVERIDGSGSHHDVVGNRGVARSGP